MGIKATTFQTTTTLPFLGTTGIPSAGLESNKAEDRALAVAEVVAAVSSCNNKPNSQQPKSYHRQALSLGESIRISKL